MISRTSLVLCLALAAASCGSKSTPATPTTPSTPTTPAPTTPSTTALTLSSPASDDQLTTLRPTLVVQTPSQALSGRTYEFQIADRSDFTVGSGARSAYYPVNLTKAGVAESATTTSWDVDQDLQPATRFYWRARWTSGTTTSDWSASGTFRTQIVGWNQPGELYDPLVNGSTLAELRFKRTTFIANRGLRIDDSDSYVRYKLKQTVTNGEFSVDIEGLTANTAPLSENPDTGKLKVFSMSDSIFSIYFSDWLMNVQYRGTGNTQTGQNGNPSNAIAFKVLYGEDDEDHKVEPNLGERTAGVRILSPSNTYHWKATWANFFKVQVYDGGSGAATGVGGSTVYDFGKSTIYTYNPPSHYAYLGVNDSGGETGSWPMAIYRNLWIANKARPASLGSAMLPKP